MKVAISASHSGFVLSSAAVKRYAALKGRPCYTYQTRLSRQGSGAAPVVEYFEVEESANGLFLALNAPVAGRMSITNDMIAYDLVSPSDRSDPDLIQVIEELGPLANGPGAEIKIVDVPYDVDWEIEDANGYESVEEVHRSWS